MLAMNTYRFRFNNGQKTSTLLFWFFSLLLTVSLNLLFVFTPILSIWFLFISLPSMLVAVYRFAKVFRERQGTEVISSIKEGFTSACFGSVLYSKIRSIQVPVKEISFLDGQQYDFYKRTDVDTPTLVFSIITEGGKKLNWILNEGGGLYNSEEDFSTFFNFLTALTDQLHQLYDSNEAVNTYLKILNEKGYWEKKVKETNAILLP